MFVYNTSKNNTKYDIYSPTESFDANNAQQESLTLVTTLYGCDPQPLEKTMEAQALMAVSKDSFYINLKRPIGLKKGYYLKNIRNEYYIIVNNPEPFNGMNSVDLIVEKVDVSTGH